MDERTQLIVGGMEYLGWTQVTVTRSMEAISGKFTVSLTDKWATDMAAWPILPGSPCELKLAGETVIRGHVDDVSPAYGESDHSITVTGRDMTADLVDCACIHSPDQWSGVTLGQIASKIAAPFGIFVRDDAADSEAFEKFKVQPGETAFEALDRACRLRGVLPVADPRVGLVLRRSDDLERSPGSPLIEGKNIKRANSRLSVAGRFSEYRVRGQRGTSDVDDGQLSFEATARDENIGRYRPTMIVIGGGSTAETARKRAEWEAAVRIGRAATASVTVTGWRREDGQLWRPGVVVPLRSSRLRLDGDFLIKSVNLSKSDSGGTVSILELVSPEAFRPKPEIPKKGAGKGSGRGNVPFDLFEITEVNPE